MPYLPLGHRPNIQHSPIPIAITRLSHILERTEEVPIKLVKVLSNAKSFLNLRKVLSKS
jgi:hypothetical protein